MNEPERSCPARVVVAMLEQRLADALRDAAMDLAVDDQRIDGAADVVDRAVAHDLDGAGLRIDLDFADMGAVGEARFVDGLVGERGERAAQIVGQVVELERGRGDLEESDGAIGAAYLEIARAANSMSAGSLRADAPRCACLSR